MCIILSILHTLIKVLQNIYVFLLSSLAWSTSGLSSSGSIAIPPRSSQLVDVLAFLA